MGFVWFRNRIVYAKYWLMIWVRILALFLRHGPFDTVRDLRRYPWILKLAKVTSLMRRLTRGREGFHFEAVCMILYTVAKDITRLLAGIFFHRERLVLLEDMVPPEICRAMGLRNWNAEMLGILLPLLDPHAMEEYIDASENEGIPPDICSLPKSTMGLVLRNEMPQARAIVSSNLPCDGGMASYTLIERECKAPVFRLDVPFHFKSARAEEYFSSELKKMIAWLEEHTPGRMDWDRLRGICRERNRMASIELEIWETIAVRPAPIAAESVYLSHLWHFNMGAGTRESTRVFERLRDMAKKNLSAGSGALKNERYRALLWNPPFLHFADLFNRVERAYGVALIIDSMSYNRLELIDTTTNETMLRGLGRVIMQGPMARHTRGPAENYLEDIFRIYRQFDIDMIWVAGHIGCKNTAALNGMLREQCREAGIPLLIVEYDLSDPRVVTHESMWHQIEYFMENVMKAKRLESQ